LPAWRALVPCRMPFAPSPLPGREHLRTAQPRRWWGCYPPGFALVGGPCLWAVVGFLATVPALSSDFRRFHSSKVSASSRPTDLPLSRTPVITASWIAVSSYFRSFRALTDIDGKAPRVLSVAFISAFSVSAWARVHWSQTSPPLTNRLRRCDFIVRTISEEQRAMNALSLRQAAAEAGVSKSTIWRAIERGRLSAGRTNDGGFAIQPAELFRVYPPKSANGASNGAETPKVDTAQHAAQQAELEAERRVAALLREQLEETRRDRDHWRDQAQQVSRLLTDQRAKLPSRAKGRRAWWPFTGPRRDVGAPSDGPRVTIEAPPCP
jgi:hypothetical protein